MMRLEKFPVIKRKSEGERGNYELQMKMRNSFICSKNSILVAKKSPLNFWSYKNNVARRMSGKLIEMIFFGLNYNAKRVKLGRKLFDLDLQKSHKIRVIERRVSQIKTKIFKRRVIFFSYERQNLLDLVKKLKSKRSQNSYSGHGLILREDKYKTKQGKVRQK